eukprot:TRINITY_DN6538_c0_g1_i4.p1 TRINITY_DN6538_c0_g1~~TRINITY_DN6538_c0_g1_i4.p1  ORF type:complete len:668 (+),score=112.83 TRINITY_DN6538_c0_g1_i4:163-2004(+)
MVVERCKPGTAADRAGLEPPFIVHTIDGKPVGSEQEMVQAVVGIKQRGGLVFPMQIESIPSGAPPPPPGAAAGTDTRRFVIRLQNPQEKLGLSFRTEGGAVRLFGVSEAAARSGLPSGAHIIIRSIQDQPIRQSEDVAKAVQAAKAGGGLEIPIEIEVGHVPPMQPGLDQSGSLGQPRAAASMSGGGGETVVPAMPMFEPAHDTAARDLLKSALESSDLHTDGQKITFQADTGFWDNFCQQAQLCEGAQSPPCSQVTASHDDGKALYVNQGFMRGFMRGWEEANPHVVVVTGPDGERTFHASKEFWTDVVERLREQARGKPPPPAGQGVQIKSNLMDGMPAVCTSAEDWNQACQQWEEKKGITPEQRQQKIADRWKEVESKQEMDARANADQELQRVRDEEERRRREEERRREEALKRPSQPLRPPPPVRRDACTQYMDPDRPVYASECRPMRSAQSPFTSMPPKPACPTCGSPRRHGPQSGGQPWVLVVPPQQASSPQRALSPYSQGWAPAPTLAYAYPAEEFDGGSVSGFSAQPPASSWQYSHPSSAAGAVQRLAPPHATYPYQQTPAEASQGNAAYWASFVKEWESVATDIQRASGPSYALDGIVNLREI